MKKFLAIAIISLVAFVGCKQAQNDIEGVFNPFIGTWNNTTLGVSTTLVLNANDSFTETVTVLGIGSTSVGTWSSTDEVMTRIYSDGANSSRYYSFNADSSTMTLSSTPEGLSTTYTK